MLPTIYLDTSVIFHLTDPPNPTNAKKFRLLRVLINAQRLHLPELVTPFELMENRYENI
ncbi:hypothetical protein RugamoR64_52590 [Duganella rhizosphaerae]|uniref:hypothetical protein n=1 Tax=Duganella rhizosphaerae TaxID=2885763 RepID=UPI000A51B42C